MKNEIILIIQKDGIMKKNCPNGLSQRVGSYSCNRCEHNEYYDSLQIECSYKIKTSKNSNRPTRKQNEKQIAILQSNAKKDKNLLLTKNKELASKDENVADLKTKSHNDDLVIEEIRLINASLLKKQARDKIIIDFLLNEVKND
jgi:hypothetical protein